MTPISPKTIANPKEAISNTEPMLIPLNKPSINADTAIPIILTKSEEAPSPLGARSLAEGTSAGSHRFYGEVSLTKNSLRYPDFIEISCKIQ